MSSAFEGGHFSFPIQAEHIPAVSAFLGPFMPQVDCLMTRVNNPTWHQTDTFERMRHFYFQLHLRPNDSGVAYAPHPDLRIGIGVSDLNAVVSSARANSVKQRQTQKGPFEQRTIAVTLPECEQTIDFFEVSDHSPPIAYLQLPVDKEQSRVEMRIFEQFGNRQHFSGIRSKRAVHTLSHARVGGILICHHFAEKSSFTVHPDTHLAVRVNDIDDTRKLCSELGFEIKEAVNQVSGRKRIFVSHPEGTRFIYELFVDEESE